MNALQNYFLELMKNIDSWSYFGFLAQLLFFMRFFVQWIASERKRQSVIPVHFWYLSLGGGILLLIYSIHRKEPVFILGQTVGTFIYLRNLYFIYKNKKVKKEIAS